MAYFYLLESPILNANATDEEVEIYQNPQHPKYINNSVIRSKEEMVLFYTSCEQLLNDLRNSKEETEEEFQSLFYNVAKENFGESKENIRNYFKMLYLLIFSADSGPRWGQFVMLNGKENFINVLKSKLFLPLGDMIQ
jgi:lysyl-tRNA synthetase class I